MPTIDQLAPATAAADGDELLVSQGGITRKITRAQVLAGVQPQLAMAGGTLLGRSADGTGQPEQVSVGANLVLAKGTLSANATPYVVAALPQGTVPQNGDLVPVAQSGTNVALTYGQFLSGVSAVANLDGSQLLVTPAGSKNSQKLADFAAAVVPASGATMTGALILSKDPTVALQAATKSYVDSQVSTTLPKSGGTLTGSLTLAGDPTGTQQAATKAYVDARVATALPNAGGTLSGALTLSADPVSGLQAATRQYVDARVSRSGDTMTGPLLLSADPTALLHAATKRYVDSQVATALPSSGGTISGTLAVSGDPSAPLQVATKHYVDAQVATALPLSGGVVTGPVTLAADPTDALQAATKKYVDSKTGGALALTGGALSGALVLSGDPSAALGAATKQYVDNNPGRTGVINVKLPPYNAKLDGQTDDTGAFKAAYQAAPVGGVIYVPNGVVNLQNPNTWGVSLTKMVKWIIDGTTLKDGSSLAVSVPLGNGSASLYLPGIVAGNSSLSAEFSQGGSQPTDFAVLHTSYLVNHSGGTAGTVSTGARNDTLIYNSPNNYIWGGLDRLLWAGTQTPSASTPAQHVARYMQTVRVSATTDSAGKALPQPQLWTACLEYRDMTGKNSSFTNASTTVEMDWYGNGADDGKYRQIQSLVVAQNDRNGAPVEVSTIMGVYLAGGNAGQCYRVFNVCIPFSTAVLDTTAAQQLTGAAAIRMAAGHAIAFEPTASFRLWFDNVSQTLRWTQGSLSFAVGKGLSVGFQSVYSNSATLPSYTAGNVVFLTGSGNYTITLPAASTVSAGTGFTFSGLGAGVVTLATSGSDAIDNGPITLRQNDRFHVVSDGSGTWREIFRVNAMSPRFGAAPVLPSYTVAALPSTAAAGAVAFTSNGRKPADSAGAGTGVEVFFDGSHWISVCSGTQVQA